MLSPGMTQLTKRSITSRANLTRPVRSPVRVIPNSHPVIRRLARQALAVTPETNRSTSVIVPLASRTSARDAVGSPFARQTARFTPDSSSFDSHSSPTMSDMTEVMTVIPALLSLITGLLFLIIAVLSVIPALLSLITGLLFLIIAVLSVIPALMTDSIQLMSLILRIMCLITGMLWLMKKVVSVITGMLTRPDRGAESPPIPPGGTLARVLGAP